MWTVVQWAFDHVPWYIPLIIIGILIAVFWQFIAPIWALLPKPVKLFLGGIVAVLTAVQYGRNKGLKDANAKRADDNANAVQIRKDIDRQVQAMPDADVTRNLERNKWLRDGE